VEVEIRLVYFTFHFGGEGSIFKTSKFESNFFFFFLVRKIIVGANFQIRMSLKLGSPGETRRKNGPVMGEGFFGLVMHWNKIGISTYPYKYDIKNISLRIYIVE